jgi:hypothetical protein
MEYTIILTMKKLKAIPKFKNEDEEREFRATQSDSRRACLLS